MVASATDSQVFEGRVSIAALWASLPDLPRAYSVASEERTPIYIERTRLAAEDYSALDVLAPKVARIAYPRPAALSELEDDDEQFVERVRAALGEYPSVTTATVEVANVVSPSGQNDREPIIRVPDGDGGYQTLSAFADRLPSPDIRTAKYVVRPRLGTGTDRPPSQLMTLWVLVFALSQLARYHPALWVEALDPDRSEIAVDLEHGLDAALELVPDLLLPALTSGAMPRLLREQQAAQREQERLQGEADAAACREQEGDQADGDARID